MNVLEVSKGFDRLLLPPLLCVKDPVYMQATVLLLISQRHFSHDREVSHPWA